MVQRALQLDQQALWSQSAEAWELVLEYRQQHEGHTYDYIVAAHNLGQAVRAKMMRENDENTVLELTACPSPIRFIAVAPTKAWQWLSARPTSFCTA